MKTRRFVSAGMACLAAWLGPVPHAQSELPPDSAPRQVFVVNTQDASVSLVDLATMKEVRRHPVGPRPYGIAVSRDGRTVAVGVEDEESVKFYSLPGFERKGKTPIGKMFNDHIVLTPDGKHVLVANFYSDDVVGIDVETMKEAFRIQGCSAPHVVKYGPLKRYAYVTCKKITGIAVIDPAGRKLVKFHQINVNPRSLTFSPDESKCYFGPFWVDGIFEMDTASGKVIRLIDLEPPKDNAAPQEVTYHGVEAVRPNILLAANEGRSYLDAVDVKAGKLLDRLTDVSRPCCVELIPGPKDGAARVLVSNIGDGTLQLVEVAEDGKLKSLGKAQVGKAPKRVAFLPVPAPQGRGALRSGPESGTRLPGSFHPVCVVHAEVPTWGGKRHDFVEQYGADPVVLIFARQVNAPLFSLVKKLDDEVARRKAARLRAVVVVLAEDDGAASAELREFAEKEQVKNVSLAVMEVKGPRSYRLTEEAGVTAILYRKYKVEANHVFRVGEWNDVSIDRVLADIRKMTAD